MPLSFSSTARRLRLCVVIMILVLMSCGDGGSGVMANHHDKGITLIGAQGSRSWSKLIQVH
jgi:hypothetical protein